MRRTARLLVLICLILLAALSTARKAVYIPFRPSDGLFSNVVIPLSMARCYPQYDIVCTGWPDDVRELFPNLVAQSDAAKADVPLVVLGSPCFIAQSPVILASPSFHSLRASLHPMLSGGGMFAPAERVMAIARSWWKRELGGASFVVGPSSVTLRCRVARRRTPRAHAGRRGRGGGAIGRQGAPSVM